MQSFLTVFNIIWDNDLFHWVTLGVFLLATSWEVYTFVVYCKQAKNDQNAINELKRDSTSKKYKEWIDEHLETENGEPVRINDKYVLEQYPEILTRPTRSNLRFVGTLCTSIGVLGTFYGIQVGISDIPLNNLNNTESLLLGVTGLLDGMKTAFSTSLMGLGTGSLFTLILFVTDSIRQSQHDKISRILHKITITGKDSQQESASSLKEIAESFKQFDFTGNLRASQALEKVAKSLDAKVIGEEVGNAVSFQLDRTIESKLTPVFDNISITQVRLTEITTIQKDVLESLIDEMKTQLIIPVCKRLEQSADLTLQASQAVTRLNNELGGISQKLADSITTIQQFQKETLTELNNFANSLSSTLGDFQTETKGVLEQTAVSINHAVAESFKGMEVQRQSFESSASQAANTFRGIREDLEQSLLTQSEQQQRLFDGIRSRLIEILKQSNQSFQAQTHTLETVGQKASVLMDNARNNLEKTLINIDETLQNTRLTVQEELGTFREQYQDSLTQFFNEQNQLLEGTLGKQRDALSEVINDLRSAFAEETQRREMLMNDLNNTMAQVGQSIQQVNQSSIDTQNRVQDIQKLTAAMGLNSAERLSQLQELSRNIGTTTQDFNNLLHNWQNHLNNYMKTSTQWQTKFFEEADSSIAQICSKLLESANAFVMIEHERKLRGN